MILQEMMGGRVGLVVKCSKNAIKMAMASRLYFYK